MSPTATSGCCCPVLVWAADTAPISQAAVAASVRRRKLAADQPNKTIEGLLGGLALALAVAIVGALMIGVDVEQLPAIAAVALVAALFSVVGDLFESMLKRHVGAKDSGNLIPGHGGVLDRLDGVLAALPVFALGKAWLGF